MNQEKAAFVAAFSILACGYTGSNCMQLISLAAGAKESLYDPIEWDGLGLRYRFLRGYLPGSPTAQSMENNNGSQS